MFEIQRPFQPPSPAGMSLPPVLSPVAGATLRPVEPPAQLHGPTGRQGGQPLIVEGDAAETAVGAQPRSRRLDPERLVDDGGPSRLRASRLAFLTQQIFQDMPGGLHLEPWAEGIGAYLRAGAEPAIESTAPAAVSFCV